MITRSIRTALLLSAGAMVLSLGACNGGGGGGGSKFFVQEFGDAPNTDLDTFLEEADGDKISITQHTGSATISTFALEDFDDILDIVDFLFFDGELPVPEFATIVATADGSDENPAHFNLTETEDFDFIFRIDSTGNLQMIIDSEDGSIFAFGAKDVLEIPEVGDDLAALVATSPGVDGPFGVLDFMSVVKWGTFKIPAEDTSLITFDFGLGHIGLVTPEADIPTEGDATYTGDFMGIYIEPGTDTFGFVAVATGDAVFTADFGVGTVEGGVFDIVLDGTNLDGDPDFIADAGDILFDAVTIGDPDGFGGDAIAGNTFSGNVVPGEGGFADFDEASIGTVDGVFYGPIDEILNGPEEAGAVLTLQDAASDDFITGVIGAELLPF